MLSPFKGLKIHGSVPVYLWNIWEIHGSVAIYLNWNIWEIHGSVPVYLNWNIWVRTRLEMSGWETQL